MTKLKLGPLIEDKPVKVTVELPGPLHRDLAAYAEVLARETAHEAPRVPLRVAAMISINVSTASRVASHLAG